MNFLKQEQQKAETMLDEERATGARLDEEIKAAEAPFQIKIKVDAQNNPVSLIESIIPKMDPSNKHFRSEIKVLLHAIDIIEREVKKEKHQPQSQQSLVPDSKQLEVVQNEGPQHAVAALASTVISDQAIGSTEMQMKLIPHIPNNDHTNQTDEGVGLELPEDFLS